MENGSKKQDHTQSPDTYIEDIILKLDKIEAKLEIVKSVVFGFGKHTYLLKEKIEQIEESVIKSKKEVDFLIGK